MVWLMASRWHIRKQKEGPGSGIAIRMGLWLLSLSTGSTVGLPSPFPAVSAIFLVLPTPSPQPLLPCLLLPCCVVWPLLPTVANTMVPPTSYSLFVFAQPDHVSFILESNAHTSIHLPQEGNWSLCSMPPFFSPSHRGSSGAVSLRSWASLPQSSRSPLSPS